MKVLYLVDTLERGGAEVSLLELCRNYREVEAVVAHLYPGDALRRELEAVGVRVVPLGLRGRHAWRRGRTAASRVIAAERPDVIHALLFEAGMLARSVAPEHPIPLIDSLVNDSYSSHRWRSLGPLGKLKLAGVRSLDRQTAGRVTRFVANSHALRRAAAEDLGVHPGRVEVIPRGRDPAAFEPPPQEELLALRHELGLAEGEPMILNVARLLYRKGQQELLRALELVLREQPHARLLLAGDGAERPALEALAIRLGVSARVHFLGTRTDVPRLLHLADVFAFPSHFEGFPGALVEAMLAGRAIVASDTPVHRECLGSGGTGVLVPVADPTRLGREIVALLAAPDQRAPMGRHARRWAQERYDVKVVARRYENLYRRMVADQACPSGGGS